MSSLKECPFCGGPATDDEETGLAFCKSMECNVDTNCTPEFWNRRASSPAVKALVEACKGLVPTLRSGDWGNQDETAREIEEAIAAVEREIGGV